MARRGRRERVRYRMHVSRQLIVIGALAASLGMALPSHAVQQVLHLPMETPNEDDGHWSGRISESQGSIEIIGRLPGAPSSNPEGPSGPQATRPQEIGRASCRVGGEGA